MKPRMKKRMQAEKRFQRYGILAITFAILALLVLLVNILSSGLSAFRRTVILVEVDSAHHFSLSKDERSSTLLLNNSFYAEFPQVTEKGERRSLKQILSGSASFELHKKLIELESSQAAPYPTKYPLWVSASSDIDLVYKGQVPRDWDASQRRVTNEQLQWIDHLDSQGKIKTVFNTYLFFNGDSRNPEYAGIAGAFIGSLYSLLVCFMLSFPIGVAAALYLEEFAPKNKLTELIEININNLAAVPSIIFGLLGLAVLLNTFGVPRSTPLAGGIVLALMTLPTIIIACRASLKAVPPSIKEGALALGASETQAVLFNVLPLALPGTLTGTIIGLAQALGETAPLLMIGMMAFISDVPSSPLEEAAALPVQIYLWAENAERGFHEKTSAAIIIILAFLFLMNITSVILRNRLEKRW